MRVREFRSDTMTQPTAAMRDAMRDAVVGDDVCGEDPTVNRLEAEAAARLEKEAALFVPSGVFGNQCAIAAHSSAGDEVLVCEWTHVVEHETGGAAALAGVQLRTLTPEHGSYPTAAEFAARLRSGADIHEPRTALILLENALSDGTVMPLAEMQAVKAMAAAAGVAVHLDGARFFNAALALDAAPARLAAAVDSVMFCLSKGLGAPVGSLLCGTEAFIRRARRRRKMMGGGMRQAGVLAAPGLIALTDGVARLAEDHENARLLAALLARVPGVAVQPEKVQTNMVFCRITAADRSAAGLAEILRHQGMRVHPPARLGLRFVISREVDRGDVEALAAAVSTYVRDGA